MRLRYSLANCAVLLVFLFLSQGAKAQNNAACAANSKTVWSANVGAETPDQAKQANAFLPNEVWICQGDSITWTFVPRNEIHTVTFLSQSGEPTAPALILAVTDKPPKPVAVPPNFTDTLVFTAPTFAEAVRPPATPPAGPPTGGCGLPTPITPSPATVQGATTTCVTSAPSADHATYTVKFGTAGNYKLVCLVHANMNGTVHVLGSGAALPFTQAQYEKQGREQAEDILSDAFNAIDWIKDFFHSSFDRVTMAGELTATAGGRHYLALVRFFPGTLYIDAGDTVEFTNADPEEPHTVSFGDELCSGGCPMVPLNVKTDADGALDGTIKTTTDNLNSGFLQAAPEDGVGRAQSPLGTTRIRVTFPNPGTYDYFCALHDVDGMKGKVVVSAGKHDNDRF